MAPFTFQSVQSLALSAEDHPQLDVRDGKIVLTAERSGERIMITAPLSGIVPTVAKTEVKTPKRRQTNPIQRTVPKGEQHKLSKLTEEQVKEIRAMAEDPSITKNYATRHELHIELARIYGVHFTTVNKIINRRSWAHI